MSYFHMAPTALSMCSRLDIVHLKEAQEIWITLLILIIDNNNIKKKNQQTQSVFVGMV